MGKAKNGVEDDDEAVTNKLQPANARSKLLLLRQQIESAEEQLEAWRQTRLRNGETLQRYEERILSDRIEALRSQESEILAGGTRSDGRDPDADRGKRPDAEDRKPVAENKNSKSAKSKKPGKKKRRAKGSVGHKRKAAVARDSPSRGISRTTGKRSRVRLIG